MSAYRRRQARWISELPTWLLFALVYAGWIGILWNFDALPLWVVIPAGAWTIAWHGSLQHEAVHGHPTKRGWVNALIAGPPLALWLPFPVYRRSHLAHHASERLTDPYDDPESFYLSSETWQRMGPVGRLAAHAMQTVVGRLILGPAFVLARFAKQEASALVGGDGWRWRVWTVHALATGGTLYWITSVCDVQLWQYALFVVYPGLSLTLLRSFIEHRPAPTQGQRSVVVEAGPLLSLLYLNNNLHALHHERPGVAWYRLPALYRRRRQELLERNGGYLFGGYHQVWRKYGLRRKDAPVIDAESLG